MPTTPINGLPSPDDNSPNDPPIHFDALNAMLDSRLIARFANVAARNSAITSPVDGMICYIAASTGPTLPGRFMYYRAGAWRGLVTTSFSTRTFDYTNITDGSDNAEYGVAQLAIPDPGYPYILEVSALVFVAAAADTQAQLRLRLDSVPGGAQIGPNVPRPVGLPDQSWPLSVAGFETGTLTGSHTVKPSVQRIFGTGTWTVAADANWLKAVVRPV